MGVIRWERGADGIVVLTLDDSGQPANTTNAAFRSSLGAVIERLERERASLTGVVVTSAKPTFATGADLRELAELADPRAAFELATVGRDHLRRLETLGRPVVAALGGAALGGGLEIALACHHRVALDAPGTQLGLPEATLGLMPSGGGVVRVVRLLGVLNALVNALLQGQRYSAARARALGLVDGLVATRDELVPAAKAWIRANPAPVARWDIPGYQIPGGGPSSPALAAALASLPAGLRRQPAGAAQVAGPAILAAAVEGAQLDVDTAGVVESRYFAELVTSQASKNLVQAFFVDMGRVVAEGAASADGPGGRARFEAPKAFVDRLLGAYLAEAAAMVGEGVPAPSVEQAGMQAGFRSSPLRLCDELTLATVQAAAAVAVAVAVAEAPAGGGAVATGQDHGALAVLDRMVEEFGRSGRASGAGFYEYADGRRAGLWKGLRELFGKDGDGDGGGDGGGDGAGDPVGEPAGIAFEELKERLLFAVALRTVGCLDEGVIGSVAAANVASLTGAGFPAWTGGALRYVNGYPGGVAGFVARARALAARHGARFAPPAPLVARAERGEPYA
ncbi:hypothetical protein BCD48_38390 [Pseudofrankia sp. BMG5.36]|nr:hypothetical protein BCD48_38390 [Pseudofrankia sp. BMG5.36]